MGGTITSQTVEVVGRRRIAPDAAPRPRRARHLVGRRGGAGFNRLSIIDIAHSRTSRCAGDRRRPRPLRLVFNGEIYNCGITRARPIVFGAVFATDGDGETILAAYHYWGAAALTRLRGMFAFALWDTAATSCSAPATVRHQTAVHGHRPGGTVVGSEKKCLLDLAGSLGLDTEIDVRALQHYTVLQYVPSRRRCTRHPPAGVGLCSAVIRPGEAPKTPLLPPRFAAKPFTSGGEQARYDEITAVLEDSVAKHMRADVTVGAFLSGGIDSTAIAALAIRHNPQPGSRSPPASNGRASPRSTSRWPRPRPSVPGT